MCANLNEIRNNVQFSSFFCSHIIHIVYHKYHVHFWIHQVQQSTMVRLEIHYRMGSVIRSVNIWSVSCSLKMNWRLNGEHYICKFPVIRLSLLLTSSHPLLLSHINGSRLKAEATPSTPLSFEDALMMSRTGRNYPSVPTNTYKTTATTIRSRDFDLNEEDWC